MSKFNVHNWDGKTWTYLATITAENEQLAAQTAASRFNLKGRFAAYPHIDNEKTHSGSNTAFTEIK